MIRNEERSHNRRSLVSTQLEDTAIIQAPFQTRSGDDLTRIVPLFARWIYEDRCPATGTPVAVPAKRRNSHYAITIFTGASFYNWRTKEGRERERGEQQRDKILGSTCALLYRSGAVLEFLHFISSSFNGVPQRSFYSVLLRPSDPGLPPLRNKKIAEIKSYPNPPSHLCAPEIRTRLLEFQGFVDDFDSNFSCKEKI